MTLRQTIQAAPGKTSDLIAKLSETSNQAIKTREGLFAQLSDELSQYIELEVDHFLPLLLKHDETKTLVPAALKGNKDLRASLAKLTALPIDTDAFLEELDVLNKSFQQHVRNERKDLLPAVLKAFSNEEASNLAANIDTAVADAEKAKRDEKREEAAIAKLEEEKAEADARAERAAAKAEREAEKTREAEKEKRAADEAELDAATEEATKRVAKQAEKVATDAKDALAVVGQAGQKIRKDLEVSSTITADKTADIYAIWMDYATTAAGINTTAAQQLMSCKSIFDVADLQRDFTTSAMRNAIARNVSLLKLTNQASKNVMDTIGARTD